MDEPTTARPKLNLKLVKDDVTTYDKDQKTSLLIQKIDITQPLSKLPMRNKHKQNSIHTTNFSKNIMQ